MEGLYYIIRIWITLLANPARKVDDFLTENYGSIENAWFEAEGNNECLLDKNNVIYERFKNADLRKKAIDIYDKCRQKNIRITTVYCKDYPENLYNTDNRPYLLYYIGKLPVEANIPNECMLAVVGSRKCTSYGRMNAFDFSKSLSECGVGIVSGLARGIDIEAHKGALKAPGYTIAVLGSGIDNVYPKEHRAIYDKIAESGCVISEYPPGYPVRKNNFPARNRIISGLSRGLLVVEATEKSGAMITVESANNQGRIVMAIPGNINSENSMGCNLLIRQGVIPVVSFGNVLDELNLKCDKANNVKSWIKGLVGAEFDVVNAILSGKYTANEIIEATKRNAGNVLSALTMLEIKGIVTKGLDGAYNVIK